MTEQYKLVPVEPTFDMCEAFEESFISNKGMNWRWRIDAGYKAMLAAAPTQPSPAEPLDREAIRNAALEEGIAALQKFASQISDTGIRTGAMVSIDQLCALRSQPAQYHPDDIAVDAFSATMKAKLAKKRDEGRGGWDTPECTQELLSGMLRNHVDKGDPVDVANLAMMLHQRGEGIQPAQPNASQAEVSDVEALSRIQSYLERKAKDRQADPELIHTYDGIFELRTEDIRSLFKAAMRAEREDK